MFIVQSLVIRGIEGGEEEEEAAADALLPTRHNNLIKSSPPSAPFYILYEEGVVFLYKSLVIVDLLLAHVQYCV